MAPEVAKDTGTGTGRPVLTPAPAPATVGAAVDELAPKVLWDVEMTEPAEEPVGTNAP